MRREEERRVPGRYDAVHGPEATPVDSENKFNNNRIAAIGGGKCAGHAAFRPTCWSHAGIVF